jgi:putative methyltransferase (TIGR04325 family)
MFAKLPIADFFRRPHLLRHTDSVIFIDLFHVCPSACQAWSRRFREMPAQPAGQVCGVRTSSEAHRRNAGSACGVARNVTPADDRIDAGSRSGSEPESRRARPDVAHIGRDEALRTAPNRRASRAAILARRRSRDHSSRLLVRDIVHAAAGLPIFGDLIVRAQTRRFNSATGMNVRLFNGIFPDFASAARAIPTDRPSGYDNEPSASRVLSEWLEITPSDYPAMFWLAKLLPQARSVFDWGGNVGLKYFAYRRYIDYPADMVWCVNDVPAVVAVGKTIAEREAAAALRFTTTLEELADADVLYSAGTLHFIDDHVALLKGVKALPPHVILGKLPISDAPAAVTLQNMGTAFCPNHLFNRAAFERGFLELGYRLVDRWMSPEMNCFIPFYPDRSIRGYSGYYFAK